MAATIYHVGKGGKERKIDVLRYGEQTRSGKIGFLDYAVLDGKKKPTDLFVRIIPVFSEAPFAPPGAHIFLTRKLHNVEPFHDHTKTVRSSRILDERMSLTELLPELRDLPKVFLRRESKRPTKLILPSRVQIVGH